MTIVGISGNGKTRILQRLCDMIPQKISHTNYKGIPLNMHQINYVKIDTPFDGAIKSIIYDFLYQFDLIMGTNYFNRYSNSKLSTSQLMPIMAQIARNVGCIIIDEIQHLKSMKSKNSNQVLSFFTNLINTVNVPLIMCGTPKAMDVLQSQFRQARRNTNVGNVMWDRMEKDEVWELFVQGMRKYQWTTEEVVLDEELSSLLYYFSQGIPDICIKLYAMCQLRCISDGQEKITPAVIKKVAEEELKFVEPMLHALRTNNQKKLMDYDDLTFPNFESFIENEKIVIDQKQVMDSLKQGVERENQKAKLIDNAVFRLSLLGISEEVSKEAVRTILTQNEAIDDLTAIVQEAFRSINIKEVEKENEFEKDMRMVIKNGKEANLSAHESLYKEGLIKQEYSISDAL